MANQRDTATVTSVDQAERIINSYAYGKELDQAIAFLKENDPKNAVLADVAQFGDDIELLKAMNALRKVEEAREEGNTEELTQIAKVLNMSNNSALRKEAMDILRELGASDVQVEQVQAMIDNTQQVMHANEKHTIVQNNAPSMSDDAIVQNANQIAGIFDDEEFKKFVWSETVGKTEDVKIIDDEGKEVENADDYWRTHNSWMYGDVLRTRMDDAAFAALDDKEKEDTLKEDVTSRFWSDVDQMETTTAESSDDKKKKKTISANAFRSSFDRSKEDMDHKVAYFNANGKEKSGSWLSRKLDKLNQFTKRIFGFTPVEVGKSLLGYFSSARGVTNTAAAVGMLAATTISVSVALGAVAVYGTYMALAPSQWSIYEKKHANWKAAKARGDQAAIKAWSGRAGLKNAYNAILANPKEKERFERQRKINMWAGLGSAAVAGIAAPFATLVTTGTALGLGVKGTASAIRISGAATNAGIQYKEANKQYKEDQTEDSKLGMKKARTAFGATLLMGAAAEALTAWHVADAFAADNAMGVVHNPEQVDSLAKSNDSPLVKSLMEKDRAGNQSYASAYGNDTSTDAPATDSHSVEVTVPDEWNANMGISQAQWNEMQDKFTGIFKNRADIFGMDNKQPHLTWQNMYQNIENAKADGALPSNMTDEQIMYKYMKLVENTERAEVVPGTNYLRSMLDGNKQPMYYVDQTQMRALNDIILCGKEVNVSADDLAKSLARINDNGIYVGEGANVGVTHNRFVGFGRGEDCPDGTNNVNAWERVKAAVRNVVKPKPEPVIDQPAEISNVPPVDAKVDQPAEIADTKPADANVQDGPYIDTKSTMVKNTTYEHQLADDDKSIDSARVSKPKVVPNSTISLNRGGMEM